VNKDLLKILSRGIVLATKNPGKIREFEKIFQILSLPFPLISPSAYPHLPEVEEDGREYLENALKKGRAWFSFLQIPVLSEDSGLEVDALGGAPGVFSRRFSGGGDEENIHLLLEKLSFVPDEKRTARYRAVAVLLWEENRYIVGEGVWEGRIAREKKGKEGFGYDPIFYDPFLHRYAGELSLEEKCRVSHRFHAIRDLFSRVLEF
jgi:XTP/dITP diphosphohydrolase